MKKISLILLLGLGTLSAFSQQRITLDLQQTIAMANDSSLEAFRTKNMYLSGYWEYRTFKANRLPSLTLNMTPAQYNRDITKRYDSEQDLDIYRSQQSFYAYGNLAIRQNFDLTGGTFYLDTELGFMRSFGSNPYTQFTSVPVRLGYSQSLVGYNAFRWERRIEPLKYEKIKKEYIYNAEQVSEQATNYFFTLAMAQAEYDLDKENAISTDTLYRIGMQRLKIASISRADLLTLKLDVVNARNTLQNAASSLKRDSFFVLSTRCSASRIFWRNSRKSGLLFLAAISASSTGIINDWGRPGRQDEKRIALQCRYQCQHRVQPGFGEVQSGLSASYAARDGFGKRFRSTDRLGGKKRQV